MRKDPRGHDPAQHDVPEPQTACPQNQGGSSKQNQPKTSDNLLRRDRLIAWINERGVICNRGGKQCVWIEGRGVTTFDPGCPFLEYVVTSALGISTAFRDARDAVKFLRSWALAHAPTVTAAALAMALPGRIYVPVANGLLRITPSGVEPVRNIVNEDNVWVTHPKNQPLSVDPATYAQLCLDGLHAIEQTIVQRMSVKEPAMAWFSTINGLWAPFLRQMFGARFITIHLGPAQAGKTTAAQLLLDALNLGKVTGDSTTAGLHACEDGLVVLDNVETTNWSSDLVQFALFAATGARRIRGSLFGTRSESHFDQILCVTSIEGAPRVELRQRCAMVEFQRSPECLSRQETSASVVAARELIHAAIVGTLERYLASAPHPRDGKALDNFSDHYTAVRAIMRCVGELLGRPNTWAAQMLEGWDRVLLASERVERRNDELEAEVLDATRRLPPSRPYVLHGTAGLLFVCSPTELWQAMGGSKTPSALSRRLNDAQFEEIRILTDEETSSIPALKRKSHRRTIGIFVPGAHERCIGPPVLLEVNSSQHPHLGSEDRCHYLFDYRSRESNPVLLGALKLPSNTIPSQQQSNALHELVVALQRLVPPHWSNPWVIPMPNSTGVSTQLLPVAEAVGLGTVLPVLGWASPMIPRAKEIAPEALAQYITVDSPFGRRPEQIVLVDDVLSTGLHFRAASLRLREHFPDVTIEGLFIFRNASGRAAAAAAGSL